MGSKWPCDPFRSTSTWSRKKVQVIPALRRRLRFAALEMRITNGLVLLVHRLVVFQILAMRKHLRICVISCVLARLGRKERGGSETQEERVEKRGKTRKAACSLTSAD